MTKPILLILILLIASRLPAQEQFEVNYKCTEANTLTTHITYLNQDKIPCKIYDSSQKKVYEGIYPNAGIILAQGNYEVKVADSTKKISVPQKATAQYTYSPNPVCEGTPVHFTSQSTGDIISWYWDYGDGSSSLLQNPIRDYPFNGAVGMPRNIIISLMVTDKYGCTGFVEDILEINGDNLHQKIVSDSNACMGAEVILRIAKDIGADAAHVSTPVHYLWSTGDTTPTVSIREDGEYSVSISDTYNCKRELSAVIKLMEKSKADIQLIKEIDSGRTKLEVPYTAGVKYSWYKKEKGEYEQLEEKATD